MKEAVDAITETIANGSVVHVAGTGHSHMLAEGVFIRAGARHDQYDTGTEPYVTHWGVEKFIY